MFSLQSYGNAQGNTIKLMIPATEIGTFGSLILNLTRKCTLAHAKLKEVYIGLALLFAVGHHNIILIPNLSPSLLYIGYSSKFFNNLTSPYVFPLFFAPTKQAMRSYCSVVQNLPNTVLIHSFFFFWQTHMSGWHSPRFDAQDLIFRPPFLGHCN